MNFTQFLLILKARWLIAVLALAVTVATTVAVSLILPKSYTASVALVVDSKSKDPITGVMLPSQLLPGYLATQVDIISSRNVALRVVDALKLSEIPSVRALQAQFAAGLVEKCYLALVHGRVRDDSFVVDAPIGPAGGDTAARRAVLASAARGSKAARTECRVRERFAAHTLLEVTPRTGRTHQIRVHLAHIGHPIVGDVLYGEPEARYRQFVQHLKAGGDPRWPGERPAGRHLLHAHRLLLRHPRTGVALALAAPPPADLTAAAARTDASSR